MRGWDCHTHTRASFDCRTDLPRLVDAVVRLGLGGVAITDHDTIEGALRLRDRRPPFHVIVGCEFTLVSGAHLIGLRLEEPIRAGDLAETAAAIRDQNGIVVLPHPFRPVTGALALLPDKCEWDTVIPHIDAIEAFNAKSGWHENQQSLALAARLKIAVTAGSDAHRAGEIGLGRVLQDAFNPGAPSPWGTIAGIDQIDERVRVRRLTEEQMRRRALTLKRAIPNAMWNAGKSAWNRWKDHAQCAGDVPMRHYGRFLSIGLTSNDMILASATTGENV